MSIVNRISLLITLFPGIHKKYFPVREDVHRKVRVENRVEVFI
jgi:hypothetical protein